MAVQPRMPIPSPTFAVESKTSATMNQSVIFSERVLRSMNSLPEMDREAVRLALVNRFVEGTDCGSLTPVQEMIVSMLSHSIRRQMALA